MQPATPKRRTQAERRDEAESRMIRATIKLMAERGYNGFSLADVAEAAGYSRGLPGHYFGPKDQMLADVAQSIVRSYQLAARAHPSEPGLPRIAVWIQQYARGTATKDGSVLSMLIAEATVRPELKRAIADLNARGLAELAEELSAGIEAKNIRQDLNVQTYAKLIYSFLRGLLSFTALDPNFNATAAADEFVAMLVSTIARTKRSA